MCLRFGKEAENGKSPLFYVSYAGFSRKHSLNHRLICYDFIKKYNPRQQKCQTKGVK